MCRIFYKFLVTKHYNIILSRSTMFGTMFGDQTLVIASSESGPNLTTVYYPIRSVCWQACFSFEYIFHNWDLYVLALLHTISAQDKYQPCEVSNIKIDSTCTSSMKRRTTGMRRVELDDYNKRKTDIHEFFVYYVLDRGRFGGTWDTDEPPREPPPLRWRRGGAVRRPPDWRTCGGDIIISAT